MRQLLPLAVPAALALAACDSDSGASLDSLPQNASPAIADPGPLSVPENTRNVTTLEVSDADGNAVTLSLQGPDARALSINNAGVLSFAIPADFEAPGDADGDNVYEVTVVASDSYSHDATLALTIAVTDVEGDAVSNTSNLVTTDDTTFVEANILSSFEYPVLMQTQTDRFTPGGVFADPGIAQGGWNNLDGPDAARIGDAAVTTCEITKTPGDCDPPVGEIVIRDFTVTHGSITFLMSGGNGSNNVGVELLLAADDSVLARYTPNSCGDAVIRGDRHYVHFETSGLIGSVARLRIFDEETGGCGFVSFDHFYQTDRPRGTQAASVSRPLNPVNVSSEPAAIANLISGASFENPPDMVENRGWVATGAFSNPTVTSWQGTTRFAEAAKLGAFAISTCEMNDNSAGCDAPVGTLSSPAFEVTHGFLNFLMAGGGGGADVGLRLLDTAGNVIHGYRPDTCGPSHIDGDDDWTAVDISELAGAWIRLQIFDNHAGGCGFVSADHFYQADARYDPAGSGKDGGAVALTPDIEATLGFRVLLPDDAFEQAIGDFDDARANDWEATGAFQSPAGADSWTGTSGVARVGPRAVSTCEINDNAAGCDAPTGTLRSPAFTVDAARPYLNFLMAGGNGSVPVGLRVLDAMDEEIALYTPDSCGPSYIDGNDDWASIDLAAQAGNSVRVEIFDSETGGCGFVSFDHVHMSATSK